MWWLKKKRQVDEEPSSFWKTDFSDCIAADYLPSYSVCQNQDNTTCRYAARYAGRVLCSSPTHKSFIPEGAERFNPHKNRLRD